MTKSIDITNTIIRIINSNGETKGTGFVLSDTLAVTCAHVVALADSEPDQTLDIRFYPGDVLQTVCVHKRGYAPHETDNDDNALLDDVAFLELTVLPPGVQSVVLGSAKLSTGNKYYSFGFARLDGYEERHVTGQTIGGIVNHSCKRPMLQLNGDLIKQGLSGGPVLDIDSGLVVGMVSEFANDAGDRAQPTARLNWATTAETLVALWPGLELADPLAEYRRFILEEETKFVSLQGIPVPARLGEVNFPLERVYIQIQAVDKKQPQPGDDRRTTRSGPPPTTKPSRPGWLGWIFPGGSTVRPTLPHAGAPEHILDILSALGEELYRRGETAAAEARLDPVEPAEALAKHRRLVILGAPGSGKSTLVRFLARQAVQQADGSMPIIIRAGAAAVDKRPLRRFALEQAGGGNEKLTAALEQQVEQGQVLWLLDGVDEAGGEASRILQEASRLPGRLLITSRPVGYPGGLVLPQFEVLPLQTDDAGGLMQDWFNVLAEQQGQPDGWASVQAAALQQKIAGRPRLAPVLRNPLLLTFLTILAVDQPDLVLPENRAELYRQYIHELLIASWEKQRRLSRDENKHPRHQLDPLTDSEAEKLLWDSYVGLGWHLHRLYYGGKPEVMPTQATMQLLLEKELTRLGYPNPLNLASKSLDFWREAGLLDKPPVAGNVLLTFRHLTFQEYAVAKYLHQRWQLDPDDTWQEIKHHLHRYTWREPFLLLAGLMKDEQLEGFIDRILQSFKPYDHPKRFFTRHKFIGTLIIIPFALLLFPILFIILAVFIPGVLVVRLLRGDSAKSRFHYTNPHINQLLSFIDKVADKLKQWGEQWKEQFSENKAQLLLTLLKQWREQWKERFSDNKPQAFLTLLKNTLTFTYTLALIPILILFFIAWISFQYAKELPKYYGEKIQTHFLSKRLQQPNARYLKKSLVAALQHETLLTAKLIGENPTKISDKTAKLVAQRLAKLMRSDIPSLARAAAEAVAGVSEGSAGTIMENVLIQDIYLGYYQYGDHDEHESYGMPISVRVLLQQARQKQMPLDTVYALLSEMNREKQFEQTISEKHQIVQYIYWARYLLSNIRRILDLGKGDDWILEILSYYDGEPPDELVQTVSDEVEWRRTSESSKSDFTVRLAQRLVRWKKATPDAIAVLASKIYGGSPSKELLDTIANGFSTGQISGDSAEDIILCIVRSLNSQQKESIKTIFTAIFGSDQPHPDIARIAVLIAIGAFDSKKSLGGPFSLITSIMPQILASGRVTDTTFDALAEGLAHHVINVREIATKILQEALQAKPNLNTGQILGFLFKVLDNDEKEVRFLAARIIKDAIKANIINGSLIEDLDPSGYNHEDAILDIQSYYQSRLNSASDFTISTRTSSKSREDIPEAVKDAIATCEAIALYEKLWSIDKTDSNGKELWQKNLARLESVAKSEHIQEEWLESFIRLYEDLEKESLQNEKLISGLPGYESLDKFISKLLFSDKYDQKWTDYLNIAHNVKAAREAMHTIVSILANAALKDTLNSASVKFLLREDTLKYTTNFHFYITVYTHIAKHGFTTLKLVETLLGFLNYTPSYSRGYWEGDKNPAVIYVLGQVYKSNPEFKEQILPVINQALLHNRYEEVDVVTKILKERLIPASELAPVILESIDTLEEISSSQTRLLGQLSLSAQYPVPTQYVKKIFNYILEKWTPLGWVEYIDGLGCMIQQETCETETFHLIVSRFLYGVHHLGPDYDEFRRPVAEILVAVNIIQSEAVDPLFTVLNHKNSELTDQNWLDAARFIGNMLNAQEHEEKCLLSTFHYLLDDADGAFGQLRTDWLTEITVQLLGFVDFQANTDFLLGILRNQTAVGQSEDIRIKAVYALTQIGYRHPGRQEMIIHAFHEVFFEEPSPLPPDDDSEFFDSENISLKMAIVSAIGKMQNYSLAPAKRILLKALEYRSRERYYPNRDLSTVAAEAFANVNLKPDMVEEIAKLLISLSSPNDQTRDATWRALNMLDVEAIIPANVN